MILECPFELLAFRNAPHISGLEHRSQNDKESFMLDVPSLECSRFWCDIRCKTVRILRKISGMCCELCFRAVPETSPWNGDFSEIATFSESVSGLEGLKDPCNRRFGRKGLKGRKSPSNPQNCSLSKEKRPVGLKDNFVIILRPKTAGTAAQPCVQNAQGGILKIRSDRK